MDILSIVILAIAGVMVVWSLLAGLARGFSRGIFRLVTVAAAAVGAFFLRSWLTGILLSTPFGFLDNKNLIDFLQAKLPENLASLSDLIVPIIEVLLSIIVFLLLFLVLSLITWIIFCFFKLALPKAKGASRLFGFLLGVVQGAACALIVVATLNGLVNNVEKLANIELKGDKPLDAINEAVDFKAYKSTIGDKVTELGQPVWNLLKVAKTSNGKETDLDAQIDAVASAAKLADKVMAMTEIKFDGGLNTENVGEIKNILANLDEIKGEMTPEAVEQVNNMISTVAESFDLPIDVSTLDLTTVNFTNEGNILETVYNYQDTGAIDDVDGLIENLADSALILPIAMEAKIEVTLDDEQKGQVEAALDKLPEGTDPAVIADLRALFALDK